MRRRRSPSLAGVTAAGQVPGEQRGGGGRGTDAPVPAPVTISWRNSVGQRAGDGHVVPSEPDKRLAVAAGDLTGGHNGDAGQRLADQQQAAGDPVGGVERVSRSSRAASTERCPG